MIRYLAKALYGAIKEQERLQALLDLVPPEDQAELQLLVDKARREVAELRRNLDFKKSD